MTTPAIPAQPEAQRSVKERPILFSGEMVRAILEGRKTQTRRVMKRQSESCDHAVYDTYAKEHSLPYPVPTEWFVMDDGCWACATCGNVAMDEMRCPYGQPGDRLWVREAFAVREDDDVSDNVIYRADNEDFSIWKPSIFMPRWASRITLEITKVRVMRVQEISEADAIAEGVDAISLADVPRQATMSRRTDFAQLWNKINAKRGFGWDTNPWVWLIEFRRL